MTRLHSGTSNPSILLTRWYEREAWCQNRYRNRTTQVVQQLLKPSTTDLVRFTLVRRTGWFSVMARKFWKIWCVKTSRSTQLLANSWWISSYENAPLKLGTWCSHSADRLMIPSPPETPSVCLDSISSYNSAPLPQSTSSPSLRIHNLGEFSASHFFFSFSWLRGDNYKVD